MPRARLPQLHSITDGSFEPNRRNPIMLADDAVLTEDYKPLKVGGKSSVLELAEDGLIVRGDLEFDTLLRGILNSPNERMAFTAKSGEYRWYSTINDEDYVRMYVLGGNCLLQAVDASGGTAADIALDAGNDIVLDATTGLFKFYLDGDTADMFKVTLAANGVTTFTTTDNDGTVGHLTLQPNGDLVLDPDSNKVIINATDGLYFDGGTDTYIAESSADNLRFVVGGVIMLDLTEGAITDVVNVKNSHLSVPAAKHLYLDGGGNTYIKETSADKLLIVVGADEMVTLDEANQRIILEASKLSYHIEGGTEYSATDSAYAGMILGYTCIGANVADDSYTLTTSYVCFPDSGGTAISANFKTPPSEYVEIEVELYFSAGSGASDLELTLSDNALYAGNSLTNPAQFDKSVREPARGHSGTVTQKWLLQADNLAAIGSVNRLFIAAKCDSTSGTPIIRWGGDASGEYTNLVMKAVALPATIVEGS